MNSALKFLSIELEQLWYKNENGSLTEDDIESECFKLKKKHAEIESSTDGVIMFDHKRLLSKAEAKIQSYIMKI